MKKAEDKVVENDAVEEAAASESDEAITDAVDTEDASEDVADSEADTAEAELAVARERLLRLQADFDNFRKRTLRERQEILRRATDDVLLELLPVLDHFDLALQAAADHDADKQLVEGFRLVEEQISTALEKFGLTPIDAEGQDFDHNLHEAISRLPSVDHADGKVLSQTRRGYKSGDRLLRPAQVVVSSGSPDSADAEADNGEKDSTENKE
jgi:molecular chaperone GrpE